jgi:hypothetical protein
MVVTIFPPLTWMVISMKVSFFLGDMNVQLRPIALMQAFVVRRLVMYHTKVLMYHLRVILVRLTKVRC